MSNGSVSLSDLEEEIRRKRLEMEQAGGLGQKYELSGDLLKLKLKKGKVEGHIGAMHERMHRAAEAAEGRWDLRE